MAEERKLNEKELGKVAGGMGDVAAVAGGSQTIYDASTTVHVGDDILDASKTTIIRDQSLNVDASENVDASYTDASFNQVNVVDGSGAKG